MKTDAAIERLYHLGVGIVGTGTQRHERPHKPLLLLAVMDMLATGEANPERIAWSPALRERFRAYFAEVQSHDDQCTPENPFLYLRSDGFWNAHRITTAGEIHLEAPPSVADASSGTVYAQLSAPFAELARNAEGRGEIRRAIIDRYFPSKRDNLAPLFEGISPTDDAGRVEDAADAPYGRSTAFRRMVLEVYDYQCAACGLRIKLPPDDLTFVDGAHLIPFSVSRNDHPTNGIALCKNHHWAMDRFLLVPSADFVWKASPRLDARRSAGEHELVALHNQPILPPHDEAFRPAPDSVTWREERLCA